MDFDLNGISGVTSDSRAAQAGDLFAALAGKQNDGHDYIDAAIAAGAVAVLSERDNLALPRGVRLLRADNARKALAEIAAALHPRRPEHLIAVTGTNGKSSAVHFARELWCAAGAKAASLGTLDGGLTTADPVGLHQRLEVLAGESVTHGALEASSHGLDQYRLDGLRFQVAGFTNISRDHLDYHGDMDAYLAAKGRLFSDLIAAGGYAVLNADDPAFGQLKALCGVPVLSYGADEAADLRLVSYVPQSDGADVQLCLYGQDYALHVPLIGRFQVQNMLCALGMAMLDAAPLQEKVQAYVGALAHIKAVPGRMEPVTGHPKRASIFVDYAHTPDALDTVLQSVRPHVKGRLFCLFGAGGDRDKGKRPLMGQVAANRSDIIIITDDNPRNEKAVDIRAQILAPIREVRHNDTVFEIEGRGAAIDFAIQTLNEDDGLVIAGKGHEAYQILGDKTVDFDDRKYAAASIKRMGK